jgi:hypothetical protein
MEPLRGSPERSRQHDDPEFHASLSKRNATHRDLFKSLKGTRSSEQLAREVAAGGEFFRRRSHLEEERDAVQCREISVRARRTMDEITIPHSRPVCCTGHRHSKGVPL